MSQILRYRASAVANAVENDGAHFGRGSDRAAIDDIRAAGGEQPFHLGAAVRPFVDDDTDRDLAMAYLAGR